MKLFDVVCDLYLGASAGNMRLEAQGCCFRRKLSELDEQRTGYWEHSTQIYFDEQLVWKSKVN